MSFIKDWEDDICEKLLEEFDEPQPKIISDFNFEMGENEEQLYNRSKLLANSKNAGTVVFVCFTGATPGEKKASGMIYPYWYFSIIIFATNRRKTENAHSDIYETLEKILLKIWKMGYDISDLNNIPVKVEKTGLYRCDLVVAKKRSYPNEL